MMRNVFYNQFNPHIPFAHPPPYDGIPQEPSPHPPKSELPETLALNDDISLTCFVDLHFGQVISSCFSLDLCKTSYLVSQSLHLYSKTGIFNNFLVVISKYIEIIFKNQVKYLYILKIYFHGHFNVCTMFPFQCLRLI